MKALDAAETPATKKVKASIMSNQGTPNVYLVAEIVGLIYFWYSFAAELVAYFPRSRVTRRAVLVV